MIWNPWQRNAELEKLVKVLRTKIDQLENALTHTEDSRRRLELSNAINRRDIEVLRSRVNELSDALKTAHRRDPKTGRILPRGRIA